MSASSAASTRSWRATTSLPRVTVRFRVVDRDVHTAADGLWVHGVVVGLVAHPVVGGQAQVAICVHVGKDRRERRHRGDGLVDALGGPAPEPGVDPQVRPRLEPIAELGGLRRLGGSGGEPAHPRRDETVPDRAFQGRRATARSLGKSPSAALLKRLVRAAHPIG